jgi:hypothetical protein
MTDDEIYKRAPGPAGQECKTCGKRSSRYGKYSEFHLETCEHYQADDPTARVLDQGEIDSLLGFDVGSMLAGLPPINLEDYGAMSVIKHLRSTRCDLQSEAADILEAMVKTLESVKDLPGLTEKQKNNINWCISAATTPQLYD